MPSRAEIESAFRSHERSLWGLAYRLTGIAADADEVVQETFVRAIERAPRRVDDQWHRWLMRVATNLSLDSLRSRRRRSVSPSWLPSPLEDLDRAVSEGDATDGRYERMESLTYAFLLALEALRPRERAALLLRDVFDHSAAEVADVLDTTEANVRVLH
ncbi:MAG: sigma-70 family RNA polymerase sigma factor, partial [Candidatus Binatia bacterium]